MLDIGGALRLNPCLFGM